MAYSKSIEEKKASVHDYSPFQCKPTVELFYYLSISY